MRTPKGEVMNKTQRLLFAGFATLVMSGCAGTQIADRTDELLRPLPGAASPQAVAEPVSRPASYGSLGGYRYRRFTAVSGA
jgi:hypothetical protein